MKLFHFSILLFCVLFGLQSHSATTTFEEGVAMYNLANYPRAKQLMLDCLEEEGLHRGDFQYFEIGFYLAKCYQLTGSLDSAFVWFEKGIKESTDLNQRFRARVALAELFRYSARSDQALQEIEACIPLVENPQLSDQNRLYFYNRYAAILFNFDNTLDERLKYINASIELAIAIGDSSTLASSLNELAFFHHKNKNIGWEEIYLRAYEVYTLLDQPSDMLSVLISLLRSMYHDMQFKKCIGYAEMAMELIPKIKGDYSYGDVYFFYSESQRELGNFHEALVGMKKYHEVFVQELTVRWNKNLEELRAQNQLVKKELEISRKNEEIALAKNEIKLINRKNFWLALGILISIIVSVIIWVIYRNIQSKNQELKRLNSENELLVSEANHRIKNNLQIITSIIRRSIASKGSKEQVADFQALLSKIESISTLHKQLYINEDKSTIQLDAYLNEVFGNIRPLLEEQGIELWVQIDKGGANIKSSVYLGLLITELCINTVKHGAAEGSGRIDCLVQKSKGESGWRLEYCDNGSGLGKGEKPKLVDLLIRQIKGEYKIESDHGFRIIMKWK